VDAVAGSELKLFKEIAATGSLSKAASICGISQSAASQHLKEVEERLGQRLVDRGSRPLQLTEAGRLYAGYCRDAVRREEEFHSALSALQRDVTGALHVASIYSIGLSDMGQLRAEFGAKYPAAHLQVDFMRPEKVYEAVREQAAELGVVSYPESSRDIAAIAWRNEEMQVALPPEHPLAGREELWAADLEGQEFIGFDEDLSIRRELDRFLRSQGIDVRITMHFDNIQTIKEAVALGSGISILPARTMQAEVSQRRLAAVRLNAPGLVRPVGIIHLKRKSLSRAAQAFLELLRRE
jgi:DNA-binding transcriptional LysR family regulator